VYINPICLFNNLATPMNLLPAKLETSRNEGKQAFVGGKGDYCEGEATPDYLGTRNIRLTS
jgi:hypothetical protein